MLDAALTRDPDHEAVVGCDGRLSYGDLDRAVDRAAAALVDLGVGRHDVVAVSLPNTTEIVVVFHAVMRVGAIFLGPWPIPRSGRGDATHPGCDARVSPTCRVLAPHGSGPLSGTRCGFMMGGAD